MTMILACIGITFFGLAVVCGIIGDSYQKVGGYFIVLAALCGLAYAGINIYTGNT